MGLSCSVSVLSRKLATCLVQAGMADHASEASTDLDEPGDKEIVLKKSGSNLSQCRFIMLKVKLCFGVTIQVSAPEKIRVKSY
jgi:hypothetical protein